MREVLGLLVAALAGAMLLAPSGAQAYPGAIHCGDTISQDTTLTSDLSDCSGFAGLILMGDTTLDLNGHTISGDANVGIIAGHGKLTIRDGMVAGFLGGVFLGKGADA